MKIKNFQVFDEVNQKAVDELMQKDLAGATALKVVKVARKLDEILKDIHQAIKVMREKYILKDEKGQPVHPEEAGVIQTNRVKLSDPIAFNKELSEILSVENEIEGEQITADEIKGVNISPKTLIILEWLIKL